MHNFAAVMLRLAEDKEWMCGENICAVAAANPKATVSPGDKDQLLAKFESDMHGHSSQVCKVQAEYIFI